MIITSVRYRKLITGPGYSHQAVEAEATVMDGDVPEDILLELSMWVRAQVEGKSPVLADPVMLREEVNQLYRQRDQLRSAVAQADLELKAVRNQIAANRPKAADDDDMPF